MSIRRFFNDFAIKPAVAFGALLFVSAVWAPASPAQDEIGFVEDFALAPDRGKALEQLIPGTEDYYFYSALHAQSSGRLDEVDALLKPWIKSFGRTPRVIEMENRQALLRYADRPAASLDFLQRRLGLRFDHRREDAARDASLPTRFDSGLITWDALSSRALQWHEGTLEGFEDGALERLASADLDARRRRDLLRRLTRPDVPGLPALIAADLRDPDAGGFGYLPIHSALLIDQLDELAKLMPDLVDQGGYVNVYLTRLLPSNDADWTADPIEREAYLDRLDAFTSRLSPAHSALRANVLYHRLVHDRGLGIYHRERFLAYLALPRSVNYANPAFLRRHAAGPMIGLQESFAPFSPLPPIVNDEELVRDYLAHFFVGDAAPDAFAPFINDVYLKELFAETKIVNGIGDMEKWYAWMPPARHQALRDRVDLDFLPSNRTHFSPAEAVGLDVAVKNVGSLIVKVFEINTPNYYRDNPSEIGTDINLDGLVAHEETLHEYDEAPLRRVVRHFDFPKLNRRGVYVVEFIGNGISSRALIRKGQLHHVQRLSSAGHVFTVLDEASKPVPGAALWIAGHEYKPGEDGTITVPYTTSPTPQPVVLIDGDFATLEEFFHEAEDYALQAGFYVDREALLRREKATVLVRPSLQVHGRPVSLSLVEKPVLLVTTTDIDGLGTTREIPDFKLHEDRESTFEFQVPDRIVSVTFQLKGQVQSLSLNKKIDVSDVDSFYLNAIDSTEHTEALHLARLGEGYELVLLGKTGEPRAGRPVQLAIKHRDFRDLVHVSLQTDERGGIALGALDGVESLAAQGPVQIPQSWILLNDDFQSPPSLQGRVGDVLSLPWLEGPAAPRRDQVSLLELRGDGFVRDRFEALSVEQGFLRISGLATGDYDLYLKPRRRSVRVRITGGSAVAGFAQSPRRLLELPSAPPLQIESVDAGGDKVRIQLRNADAASRVHVIATRYLPAYDLFSRLGLLPLADLSWATLPSVESLYVSGRNIGDEYRYILDRKYAEKFPGNMLARPGLLLNPWAIRETQTGRQTAEAGAAWDRKAQEDMRADGIGGPEEEIAPPLAPVWANLDFLAEPAVTLLNLEPNDQGVIEIDRKALLDKPYLHVLAATPEQAVYRQLALSGTPAANVRDLRLAAPLDPARHFTEQKQITLLGQGQSLAIEDMTTSRLEVYDALPKAYNLYLTLSGDVTLREFAFILDWPSLTDEQKRDKYSEFACHELNFFLARKDPDFFAKVVQPYLKNKKDKTFLDRWLIGDDLKGYLEPLAYERLNVVERILLARRIREEAQATARHLKDSNDLIPPDLSRLDFLFETALKGSALETADKLGFIQAAGALGEMNEQLLDVSKSAVGGDRELSSRMRAGAAAAPSAPMALEAQSMDMATAAPSPVLEGGQKKEADQAFYARDEARRAKVRRLYQPVDQTKEWAENNYYELPADQQNGALIPVNAFWVDYANHEDGAPFLSSHLAEASSRFTEIMFALAVLDLPFKSPEASTKVEDRRFSLTAPAPQVAYHKEIKPAEADPEALPILVTQNFFRFGDRYIFEGNEQRDKFVKDEFLVNVVYGCQVVVSNPTSTPAKLGVLLQIPEGAVPVLGGHVTRTIPADLAAFTTQAFEYYFYFPLPGDFAHYPVHVARRERVVASAEPVRLKAVLTPSVVDKTSWDYLSQYGSEDDVVEYLNANNLGRVDLDRIAWRMADRGFFRRVLDLLAARHAYQNTLWSYALKHNDPSAARQFLRHQDGFVAQCGAWLKSPLLDIEPVERGAYEHLEYDPLINPRAHRLGKRHHILNDRFYAQYTSLLNTLAYRPALGDDDRLALAYYLLLQDRVAEGAEQFGQVERDAVATAIQYDYVAAYLDFYRSEPEAALRIAQGYAGYPVDKWRKRFEAVVAQAEEIRSGRAAVVDPENRDQTQTQLAETEPSFDFSVKGAAIDLRYQNLTACRVNFYLMDVELLFSRNPFVQEFSGQFSSIRPNEFRDVELPADTQATAVEIPEALRSRNLMIEVIAAGKRKTQPYYSGKLIVQVIENYGQVKVTAEADGKPLARVYVKAYARMKDGEVRFYKDGYTDLRGRFDYTSLSTNDLEGVDRLALLVLSEELGAVVREAAPPKR